MQDPRLGTCLAELWSFLSPITGERKNQGRGWARHVAVPVGIGDDQVLEVGWTRLGLSRGVARTKSRTREGLVKIIGYCSD